MNSSSWLLLQCQCRAVNLHTLLDADAILQTEAGTYRTEFVTQNTEKTTSDNLQCPSISLSPSSFPTFTGLRDYYGKVSMKHRCKRHL